MSRYDLPSVYDESDEESDDQKTKTLRFANWVQNCTGPGTEYADPARHTFEATVSDGSSTKWTLRTPDVIALSKEAYTSAQCSEGGSSTVFFRNLVDNEKSQEFGGMTEEDLKNLKDKFDRVGDKIVEDPADVQVVG